MIGSEDAAALRLVVKFSSLTCFRTRAASLGQSFVFHRQRIRHASGGPEPLRDSDNSVDDSDSDEGTPRDAVEQITDVDLGAELILGHHEAPIARLVVPDVIAERLNTTHLRQLYLHDNALTALPSSLCLLAKLELLDVRQNALAALPAGIGAMVSLRELHAGENRLAWLPPSLARCRQLRVLAVDGNALQGLPRALVMGGSDVSKGSSSSSAAPAELAVLEDAGNPWRYAEGASYTPFTPPLPTLRALAYMQCVRSQHRIPPPAFARHGQARERAHRSKKKRRRRRLCGLAECAACGQPVAPPDGWYMPAALPQQFLSVLHRRSGKFVILAWPWCGAPSCARGITEDSAETSLRARGGMAVALR